MKQEIFVAADGRHLGCVIWNDVKRAQTRGMVQLIHGMDEDATRYDRFAKFLNENGYIVFAADYRTDGTDDIFSAAVADELQILDYLKRQFRLPVFLFGQGYGSFITQKMMSQTKSCTAGVCLSGTARYPATMLWPAITTAWIGMHTAGRNAPARMIEFFAPTHTKKTFSYGFYYSLFKNLMGLEQYACTSMPLLIISGNRDAVNMNGRLAKSLYRAYLENGMDNLTIIIYPDAHHELLMDLNYQEVQHDILKFFNDALRHRPTKSKY